jgi:hypothetical protein
MLKHPVAPLGIQRKASTHRRLTLQNGDKVSNLEDEKAQ